MNIRDLQFDEKVECRICPICGEPEFKELKIWDHQTEEGISTGDWVCDNCEAGAVQTQGGELLWNK